MLALEGVTLRSRATGVLVLDGVDLDLAAGDVVLIAGPSGGGKSALIELACGLARPATGQVRVFGRDLARLRRTSLARLRRLLGVAFDEPLLLDDETALASVELPLELAGVPGWERAVRAAAALERLGVAALAGLPASALSGGDRRRVALARALVTEPRLLLFDDPTASFNPPARAAIVAAIGEHAERGGAALVTTADAILLEAAELLGWRRYELERGGLRSLDVVAGRPAVDDLDDDVVDNLDHDGLAVGTRPPPVAPGEAEVAAPAAAVAFGPVPPNVLPFPVARIGARE